jgi:hypothetical protein
LMFCLRINQLGKRGTRIRFMLLEEEGSRGLIILDFALQMAFCFVCWAFTK